MVESRGPPESANAPAPRPRRYVSNFTVSRGVVGTCATYPACASSPAPAFIDGPMLARLMPLTKLDDARLAARAGTGDAAAFAALYDRHDAGLLAFCRHMLGNREDGEDALQQTFIRAHGAMLRGQRPDEPRAWLFAIARNRCRTMLSARRDTVADGEQQLERVCVDGLPVELQQRAELRELLADMTKLPEDQRAALLLTELRGFSQEQIARVLDCPSQKVKALVFQARTHLLAEREARDTGCVEIRQQLEVARGGDLRRGLLRRHLRRCEPCKAYSIAVAAQRHELGGLMAVLPSAGLKLSVLGAVGLTGAGSGAGGAGGAAGLAGGGVAAAGPGAAAGPVAVSGISASAAGGIATKLAAVKIAAVVAVSGAAVGGTTAIVGRDGQGAERASVRSQNDVSQRPSNVAKRAADRLKSTARTGRATRRSQLAHRRAVAPRRARAGERVGARARASARKRDKLRRAARLRRATRQRPATRLRRATRQRPATKLRRATEPAPARRTTQTPRPATAA
ncbi:MAG: hypothetical protein QOD83_3642, partial [Solirubrobacteraceae bacterium]|nr:hypothetical protein [Solirubrobacteraceae bacterium]